MPEPKKSPTNVSSDAWLDRHERSISKTTLLKQLFNELHDARHAIVRADKMAGRYGMLPSDWDDIEAVRAAKAALNDEY